MVFAVFVAFYMTFSFMDGGGRAVRPSCVAVYIDAHKKCCFVHIRVQRWNRYLEVYF